jgi:hypothetical protein
MADERKPGEVVDLADGTKYGYWGASPVHKDRKDYTVEVQGPIAEEASQGGARAEGVGTVDKSAGDRQAVRRTRKENDQ